MVTIFVCISCRRQTADADGTFDRPGPELAEAVRQRLGASARSEIVVRQVDCLAVCNRPCTVALSGHDKWTYLIGDLDPQLHVEEIVTAAFSFLASENGIVPWRQRPASFRKGVIARVPPATIGSDAS
jgi:predicted metal-binding protein